MVRYKKSSHFLSPNKEVVEGSKIIVSLRDEGWILVSSGNKTKKHPEAELLSTCTSGCSVVWSSRPISHFKPYTTVSLKLNYTKSPKSRHVWCIFYFSLMTHYHNTELQLYFPDPSILLLLQPSSFHHCVSILRLTFSNCFTCNNINALSHLSPSIFHFTTSIVSSPHDRLRWITHCLVLAGSACKCAQIEKQSTS